MIRGWILKNAVFEDTKFEEGYTLYRGGAVILADLDYVKKIISWTALGYILYKVSLTKIFFNNRHKHVDLFLIIAYFMLIIKNIVLFSSGILEEFIAEYNSKHAINTANGKYSMPFMVIIITS